MKVSSGKKIIVCVVAGFMGLFGIHTDIYNRLPDFVMWRYPQNQNETSSFQLSKTNSNDESILSDRISGQDMIASIIKWNFPK